MLHASTPHTSQQQQQQQHSDDQRAEPHAWCQVTRNLHTLDLIRSNLHDSNARHLLLITENYAALQLLTATGLLAAGAAKVIVGSTFRDDRTQLAVGLVMQEIIACMSEGRTVVLVETEQLYESLYDMLNQHYRYVGEQRYARMALGSDSRYCRVRPRFIHCFFGCFIFVLCSVTGSSLFADSLSLR